MFSIPNLLTLGNLLTGSAGIIYFMSEQDEKMVFWFILIAAVFDFADGFFARLLKVSSPMGKELDSLADMVSFGAFPGIVMVVMIMKREPSEWLPWIGLLIIAFSALRLAKFNVDKRQSDTFYGLPTPGNAFFFGALPYLNYEWLNNGYLLAGLCILFSYFLVADIRMFALKFKSYKWKANQWKYMAIVASVASIAIYGITAVSHIIALYVLFSFILHFSGKRK